VLDFSDEMDISLHDHANRLVGVTQESDVYSFAYLGSGDRIGQTVNGVTATYTLDLNTGLTQVLSDGMSTYLYGNGRIAQMNGVDSAYTTRAIPGNV
jgi:YD repeat-containing protein